jgi:hypothetical protein
VRDLATKHRVIARETAKDHCAPPFSRVPLCGQEGVTMSMSRREVAAGLGALAALAVALKETEASADCGHITGAIQALNTVQKDLQAAAHDFGGHKAGAMAAIGAAQTQLGLCMSAPQCKT